MNLAKIATDAGLSPTFINWFEQSPEEALRELFKFWKLKRDIEWYLYQTRFDVDKYNNHLNEELKKKIDLLVKDELF